MNPTSRKRATLIVTVLALLAAGPAGADTYYVDRFTDSISNNCSVILNDCSLRGAIMKANQHAGPDVVVLAAGTYTLSLAGRDEDLCLTGDLDVQDALVIEGKGPERTTIDAAGIDRVLDVQTSGERVTLRGVTVTGGAAAVAGGGSGIRVVQGSIRVEGCAIRDNSGAAISASTTSTQGRTEVIDSWVTGNTFSSNIIWAASGLHLERSTVSGNSSEAGATVAFLDSPTSQSALLNSTISDNLSWFAGVYLLGTAFDVTIEGCTIVNNGGDELKLADGASAVLSNTLIGGACGPVSGLTSLGGNLESPGDTCGLGPSDLVNVADPHISNLRWLGGPTPVHRPLAGSPAIDRSVAGPNCPPVDQRGQPRPRDGGGSAAAVCDIGAVEVTGAGELFVENFECGILTPWSVVAD